MLLAKFSDLYIPYTSSPSRSFETGMDLRHGFVSALTHCSRVEIVEIEAIWVGSCVVQETEISSVAPMVLTIDLVQI